MVDDSRTQIENDSVGAYHFFVGFGPDGSIIPRQKKQIESLLASGVPKWAITIYIGSEDCELPYSVDELIAIGALEEPKTLIPITQPLLKPVTAIATPPPLVSSTKSMLRKDLWERSGNDPNGIAFFPHQSKSNPKNYIEHYISSPGDVALLPWEDAKQIIDKFGFNTAKLQLIFAAHTINQTEPWKSSFSLKASDISKELGWNRNHERLSRSCGYK